MVMEAQNCKAKRIILGKQHDITENYAWLMMFHFFQIYGQVDRLVQPLISTQMEGGYKTKGAAVKIPPNSYTYSDTGMFQDPDSGTWYLMTSADHNTVQINEIKSDGTLGDRKNYVSK